MSRGRWVQLSINCSFHLPVRFLIKIDQLWRMTNACGSLYFQSEGIVRGGGGLKICKPRLPSSVRGVRDTTMSCSKVTHSKCEIRVLKLLIMKPNFPRLCHAMSSSAPFPIRKLLAHHRGISCKQIASFALQTVNVPSTWQHPRRR
jgi:hypothetical protein